jgi:flotillin
VSGILAVVGGGGAILFVVAFFLVMAVMVYRNLLYICGPNEVLIFSGRRREIEGRPVGYRVIKGGRSIRVPLFETVDRMDLTNMIIDVSVSNAYSKGGVPLHVQGVANVKVAGTEPVMNNAIERFVGSSRDEIMQVAKDTLQGNLRGVLAQLTPEQVNEDKIAFEEKLLEEAEHDMTRLGLVLDTLKIQNVGDDRGYLNSIGRKQSAELIKTSRVAEATSKATSLKRDAENRTSARVSALSSETEIARAANDRRIKDTLSRREALIAEEVGKVKAAIARAEAELKAQAARIEQVRHQLEADVVAPAAADMEKRIAEARAGAAAIEENGKATTTALRAMVQTWKSGGDASRDIFVMQKLRPLLGQLTATIQTARIGRITVLPADARASARTAVTLAEEVRGALGVDVPAMIEGAVKRP